MIKGVQSAYGPLLLSKLVYTGSAKPTKLFNWNSMKTEIKSSRKMGMVIGEPSTTITAF